MDNELIKSRNVAKCVSAALALFNGNIKRIVSALWLPILVGAIVMAANMTISFSADRLGKNVSVIPYVVTVAILMGFVVYVWLSAALFNLLNAQGLKRNIIKVSKVVLTYLALVVVLSIILGVAIVAYYFLSGSIDIKQPGAFNMLMLKMMGIIMLFSIILGLLFLPFVYSYFAYMMEEGSFRKTFFPAYKVGLRHWGFLFVVFLVLGLIMFVLSAVLAMPLIILTSSQAISLRGMMWGDPSGLPSYFPWLFFVTIVIVYCILYMLLVWENFVIYYAYGSIKRNELDRKAKAINHQDHEENTVYRP